MNGLDRYEQSMGESLEMYQGSESVDDESSNHETVHEQFKADETEQSQETSGEEQSQPSQDEALPDNSIPESYTLDGGGEFDAVFMDSISPALKEVGLTNKSFNNLASSMVKYAEANNERMAKETMADPYFSGGDANQKFGIARKAIEDYGGQKLLSILTTAGLSNNVEVIRAFHKIGSQTREGGSLGQVAPSMDNSPEAILKRMYPND